MPDPLRPNFGAATNLGAFVEIHGVAGPQIVIRCRCPASSPLLIPGFGAIATCPACKRSFAIKQLTFDGQEAQVQVGPVSPLIPM